jgi:7-cyano-7-deazaguanine reductase
MPEDVQSRPMTYISEEKCGMNELYGSMIIREASLDAFDNRTPDRDYTVQFTIPEFTCVCPKSGFPDFAAIYVRYVPDLRCVELKSLKLYINQYRDRAVYHEDAANGILRDLVELLNPRYCGVVGDFNVRGNIKTIVSAVHRSPGWSGEPDPWWFGPGRNCPSCLLEEMQ